MKIKINNENYDIYFQDNMLDDKKKPIGCHIDHEAKEISFSNEIPLGDLHFICLGVALSIFLRNDKKLSFLSANQLDRIVDTLLRNKDNIKIDESRLIGSICGYFSR